MPARVTGFQIFDCPECRGRETGEGDRISIPVASPQDRGLKFDLAVEDNEDDIVGLEIRVFGDECATAETDAGDDGGRAIGRRGKADFNAPVLATIFPRGPAEFIFNCHHPVPAEGYRMSRHMAF